jgi:branched-chain amino acid transport system ATP-binding protein
MLELQHVTRRFGGHAAVLDVSLRVETGSLTGLIGPNGAGKSTLFNLVAGALAPSTGRILLDGGRIDGEPPHRVLARGVARTFQIPRPFPAMTVLENVMLAARGQRGERFWANWTQAAVVAAEERRHRDRAYALLEFLDLAGHAGHAARVLSGGQRKLLELARALMTEPRLLLLDEPAAGVSPALLETLVDRIGALNRQGVTILVIEHNLDVVMGLCRSVVVMAGGALLAAGEPDAVRRDPRVIDAYLGGAPL